MRALVTECVALLAVSVTVLALPQTLYKLYCAYDETQRRLSAERYRKYRHVLDWVKALCANKNEDALVHVSVVTSRKISGSDLPVMFPGIERYDFEEDNAKREQVPDVPLFYYNVYATAAVWRDLLSAPPSLLDLAIVIITFKTVL